MLRSSFTSGFRLLNSTEGLKMVKQQNIKSDAVLNGLWSQNTCERLEFEMLKLPMIFSPSFLYFLIWIAKPQLVCCQGRVTVLSARLRKPSFWGDVFLYSFHRAVNSHASRRRPWAAEIWSRFHAFSGYWCIVLIRFNSITDWALINLFLPLKHWTLKINYSSPLMIWLIKLRIVHLIKLLAQLSNVHNTDARAIYVTLRQMNT